MSDDERDDPPDDTVDGQVGADTERAAQPVVRARPSAASRARRIGGLPTAAPRSTHGDKDAAGADAATAVSVEKRPTVAEAAPDEDDAPRRSRESKRTVPAWLAWLPAAAFVAVAIVFLALLIVSRVGNSGNNITSAKQREIVLAAAKNCVAATNTYKYTDVDSYERAGLACSTGVYAKQYRTAMDTLIKKNAPTQKFTQIAQVNLAGIESVTDNGKQWSALVYGQLNITNVTTGKQGRVDPFSVVVTMEQAGGKWLIGNVRLVSTPS